MLAAETVSRQYRNTDAFDAFFALHKSIPKQSSNRGNNNTNRNTKRLRPSTRLRRSCGCNGMPCAHACGTIRSIGFAWEQMCRPSCHADSLLWRDIEVFLALGLGGAVSDSSDKRRIKAEVALSVARVDGPRARLVKVISDAFDQAWAEVLRRVVDTAVRGEVRKRTRLLGRMWMWRWFGRAGRTLGRRSAQRRAWQGWGRREASCCG